MAIVLSNRIWRNDVHFTNWHSSHIGIHMMDSTTIEHLRNEMKQLFKIRMIWKYSFVIWISFILLDPELKCASLLKIIGSFLKRISFKNSKRSFNRIKWLTGWRILMADFGNYLKNTCLLFINFFLTLTWKLLYSDMKVILLSKLT